MTACFALGLVPLFHSLLHTSVGYDWDADYGDGGEVLNKLIDWYKFDQKLVSIKSPFSFDRVLSGTAGAMLLLHWGDLAATQKDWAARADDWQSIARSVRRLTLQVSLNLLPSPQPDPIRSTPFETSTLNSRPTSKRSTPFSCRVPPHRCPYVSAVCIACHPATPSPLLPHSQPFPIT